MTSSQVEIGGAQDLDANTVCVKSGESFWPKLTVTDTDGFRDIKWLQVLVGNRIFNSGHDSPFFNFYYQGITSSNIVVPNPVLESYACVDWPDNQGFWQTCTGNFICMNTNGSVSLANTSNESQLATSCPNSIYAFRLDWAEKKSTNDINAEWRVKPLQPFTSSMAGWAIDFSGNQTNAGNWVFANKTLVYPCPAPTPSPSPTPTPTPTPSPTPTPTQAPPVLHSNCQTNTNAAAARVIDGLITVGGSSITGNFSSTNGVCVLDPKAAFNPLFIPTFDDLKSLYFQQK